MHVPLELCCHHTFPAPLYDHSISTLLYTVYLKPFFGTKDILQVISFHSRAIGSWWVDRCRCTGATPDAAATNEGIANGNDCNGCKAVNNGSAKNDFPSASANAGKRSNHEGSNSAATATERLELLSSSKGQCAVSVIDSSGKKTGSMV